MSDHSLITAELSCSRDACRLPLMPPIYRRRWNDFDADAFERDLRAVLASDLACNPPSDCDSLFVCYDTVMRRLIDQHAPLVPTASRRARDSPWFDHSCRRAKAITRRCEKIFRKTRTSESYEKWRAMVVSQRRLFQTSYSSYWQATVDKCADSKALWKKLNGLLQPSTVSEPSHTAEQFATFFNAKIETIRAASADAPPPTIRPRVVEQLNNFNPTSADEMDKLIMGAPNKQCDLDPVPTWLIKKFHHIMAPVFCHLVNASLSQGHFPRDHKSALVRPLIKKATLDPLDLKSYRPISNLSFVSKCLERTVVNRLSAHSAANELLPACQSAYRHYHSTETAVVKIHNDIARATDSGFVSALVLLDLSAAFDTVDTGILLDVQRIRFGVQSTALEWYRSYLSDRSQTVVVGSVAHGPLPIHCGVPQRSGIGPSGIVAYTEELGETINEYSISFHCYADDTALLSHIPLADITSYRVSIERCLIAVHNWFRSRRLQLNAEKTELIWLGTRSNINKLHSADTSLTFDGNTIRPVTCVKYLGVFLDTELGMKRQVNGIAAACFFQLRRLRQLRNVISPQALQRVVSALVLSRLDYCNAVLAGLPASTLAPLQRVQNAAARLVAGLGPRDHVTPALRILHWLPVAQRIQYKLCVLAHTAFYKYGPSYITEMLVPVSDLPGRSRLRSADSLKFDVPRVKSAVGSRAFSVSGPRTWNDLPQALRATSDRLAFKRQLKTHFFNIAFPTSS